MKSTPGVVFAIMFQACVLSLELLITTWLLARVHLLCGTMFLASMPCQVSFSILAAILLTAIGTKRPASVGDAAY